MLEVNFDPFPVLTTERLILRRITKDDVNALYKMRSNEDIMKYIHKPRPKDTSEIIPLLDKIDTMIDNNEGVAWAMTLKGDNTMMGHISYHILIKAHYRAEVGYMMQTDHHSKGLMDEALKAVLHYGFYTMGLHSIEGHVNPVNKASRKLLEKNGFVQEAYFKENFFFEGKFSDTVIYTKLTPLP